MTGIVFGSAYAVLTVAALALYLASPHQKLVQSPLPRCALAWTGVALLVVALAVLASIAGSATAVYIHLTILMLLWSVPPLALAWWRAQGEEER